MARLGTLEEWLDATARSHRNQRSDSVRAFRSRATRCWWCRRETCGLRRRHRKFAGKARGLCRCSVVKSCGGQGDCGRRLGHRWAERMSAAVQHGGHSGAVCVSVDRARRWIGKAKAFRRIRRRAWSSLRGAVFGARFSLLTSGARTMDEAAYGGVPAAGRFRIWRRTFARLGTRGMPEIRRRLSNFAARAQETRVTGCYRSSTRPPRIRWTGPGNYALTTAAGVWKAMRLGRSQEADAHGVGRIGAGVTAEPRGAAPMWLPMDFPIPVIARASRWRSRFRYR